jgi:hypothetical protein
MLQIEKLKSNTSKRPNQDSQTRLGSHITGIVSWPDYKFSVVDIIVFYSTHKPKPKISNAIKVIFEHNIKNYISGLNIRSHIKKKISSIQLNK